MATNTLNYNLVKPDGTEFYDIAIFNNNADLIDTQMKVNEDGVTAKTDLIFQWKGPENLAAGFSRTFNISEIVREENLNSLTLLVNSNSLTSTTEVTFNGTSLGNMSGIGGTDSWFTARIPRTAVNTSSAQVLIFDGTGATNGVLNEVVIYAQPTVSADTLGTTTEAALNTSLNTITTDITGLDTRLTTAESDIAGKLNLTGGSLTGALTFRNPGNPATSFIVGWDSNRPRFIVGGTGPGHDGAFTFEGAGGSPIASFNEDNSTISGNLGVGPGVTVGSPASLLHASSGGGANGDAVFILEADTDDTNEDANPLIELRQDGGQISSIIGLDLNNALVIRLNTDAQGDMLFQTSGVLGQTATTKMSIDSVSGNVDMAANLTVASTITGDNIVGDSLDINGRAVIGDAGFPAADPLWLRAGSTDHVFMPFYARTATPTARSGYIGYGAAGFTTFTMENEIGQITLRPLTGNPVVIDGNIQADNFRADTSVVFGESAAATTTLDESVVIGNQAGQNPANIVTSVLIGPQAGQNSASSPIDCVYIGHNAGEQRAGSRNVGIGRNACRYGNGNNNVAIGNSALGFNTMSNFSQSNVAIGDSALETLQDGNDNVAIGRGALDDLVDGSSIVAIGANALGNIVDVPSPLSIDSQVAIGLDALSNLTSGSLNVALGASALQFAQDGTGASSLTRSTGIGYDSRVSGSDQLQLGRSGTTVYGASTYNVRSDRRDKTDIQGTDLGLNFITKLKPVKYRWNMRDDYFAEDENGKLLTDEKGNLVPIERDGSKKRKRLHEGFIAQDVKEVLDELGTDFAGYQDHKINGGCDVLTLGYEQFIGPIVKAMQEQQQIIEGLQKEIKALRKLAK